MAKGYFSPKHPEKYLGDPSKIRFLSSWELSFMNMLDTNPFIIEWASEEFRIPYFKPTTQKIHHYIPDFFIMYMDKDGKVHKEIIEIKPLKQAVITKKMSTYDAVNVAINRAKWTACKSFCDNHGITFRVLTEHELFKQGKRK
jgi:hypothetical protein